MKAKEIRSMTESEIESKLAEFQDKYFKQRIQKSLGQAENPQKQANTKRDIAKLLTILAEKKRSNDGESKQSGNETKKG
jgi:large subunit ribosomal protein L29